MLATILGGIASAIYINKEAKTIDEVQEEKKDSKEDNMVMKAEGRKLNLFSDTDKVKSLTQEKKDKSKDSVNLGVDIVNVNTIRLNQPKKANYIQEGNRRYSNYGFNTEDNSKSRFYNSKNFYYLVDRQQDMGKLNKLKKPKSLKTIDETQENIPNVHKEQLKTSRIVFN